VKNLGLRSELTHFQRSEHSLLDHLRQVRFLGWAEGAVDVRWQQYQTIALAASVRSRYPYFNTSMTVLLGRCRVTLDTGRRREARHAGRSLLHSRRGAAVEVGVVAHPGRMLQI
jgi:hypothetical protein